MKRYRDAARRLTMTIDEIAAATLAEVRKSMRIDYFDNDNLLK